MSNEQGSNSRIQQLKELHQQGLSNPEIVMALGVSRQRVHQLMQQEGLQRNDPTEKLLVEAEAMWLSGMSIKSIAEQLGFHASRINQLLNTSALYQKHRIEEKEKRKKWRRRITSMIKQGKTKQEMVSALQASPTFVQKELERHGILQRTPVRSKEQRAQHREQVKQLRLQGLTTPQIAQQLGIGADVVNVAIRENGLTRAYRQRPMKAQVNDRRVKVKELALQGMQAKQIATALDMTYAAVVYDLGRLGMKQVWRVVEEV